MTQKFKAYIKSLDRTVAVTQIVLNPAGDVIYIFSADTGQDHYGHDVDLIINDKNIDKPTVSEPKEPAMKLIKMVNKSNGFVGYINDTNVKVKAINPSLDLAETFTKSQAERLASTIDKNKYLVSIVDAK